MTTTSTQRTARLDDLLTRVAGEPLGDAGLLGALARADDLAARDAQTADVLRRYLARESATG